jgi:hypothetical protein
MFVKLLFISAVFLLFAIALLGIRILLKSNGRFPETHVGHNKEMSKRGIKCAQKTDIGCNPNNNMQGCKACNIDI